MIEIKVCVGSSCHLKGSYDLVQLFQKKIQENHLEAEVNLGGSFCQGVCNRAGVTVCVNDEVFPGVAPENFNQFWAEHVGK